MPGGPNLKWDVDLSQHKCGPTKHIFENWSKQANPWKWGPTLEQYFWQLPWMDKNTSANDPSNCSPIAARRSSFHTFEVSCLRHLSRQVPPFCMCGSSHKGCLGNNCLSFMALSKSLVPLLPHEMIIGTARELCDIRDVVVNAPEPLTREKLLWIWGHDYEAVPAPCWLCKLSSGWLGTRQLWSLCLPDVPFVKHLYTDFGERGTDTGF